MVEMDLTSATDDVLAEALKAANGGPGAVSIFEELVRRHQGKVYAVAYRITSNREDALDVTQDALVKAYRKIGLWYAGSGFVPWLMRLAANAALDQLRRRRRRWHESLSDDEAGPARSVADHAIGHDPARQAQASEIAGRVQEALNVLSPAQKTVFVLRHYEGLQLAEIAEALGCTVGSVKVHLFRAVRKLQQELEGFRAETD